jgi:E3 ubiquitin-protein ligase UBR3
MTGLESDNELPPLIDEDEVACETRDKDTPSLMEDILPLVDSEDEEMPGLEDIPSSAPIEGLGTAPQPSPLLSAQLLPAEESSQSTRTRPVQRTAHLVHLPRLQPQQQRQQGEPASVQIRNLYRNMFNLFNDAMIQQMPHREQHQHHHHHRAGRHSHHHRRQQISEFDELEEAAEGEPEEPVNVGSDADGEAEVGQDVEGRSGGIGIGFCGHRVHIDCFDRYFSALVRSHVHGDEYEGDRLVLLERLEFLCPVCRRLANCLVPLVPVSLYADLLPPLPPASFPLQQPPLSLADFDSWLLKAPMLTSSCPQPQHQPSEEQKRLAASALEQVMDTFVGRLVSVQKGRSHEYAVSDSPSTPYVWSTFSLLLCLHEINSRGTDSLALPDPLRQLAQVCLVTSCPLPIPIDCLLSLTVMLQTIFRIGFVHKADDKAARQRYRDLLRRQLLGHPLERRAQQAPEEISPEHHWEAFLFSPVLAADPFALLCRLAFLWPEPLDLPRLLALVRLMYLVVVCQCLLSLALHTPEPQRSSWLQSAGPPPPSVSAVASPTALFALLAALIPPEEGSQNAASSLPEAFCPQPRPVPAGPRVPELEHALETLLEPFLRRATLLLMTWNDLRLQPAADASLPPAPSPVSTSPAHLRAFLSLPAPEELFVPGALNGASGFAVHTWIRQLLQAMSDERAAEQPALPWQIIPQVTPALPLQLTPLPPLYHDLIARVADADCLECEEPCGQATLCLVCGATVCSNTECVPSHADACCAGNGLFLVVPTTEVLLLRGERYAFWGSLYLDKHGEPDPELRRGRPLYLNQDRVALLTRLFLKQVWEHDTRVLESTHLFEDHPPAHFRHGA